MMKSILRPLALLALLAAPLAAASEDHAEPEGAGTASAAPGENVVNVYSARHYDTDVALFDAFTERTGIEVELIEAGADELIERIRSEGRNSPADVIITVDAGRLWRAEQAGLLAPIDSEVLEEAIPENLRHPEGRWFGLAQRVRGIVYAEGVVDPSEITSYDDLADERWRDRICIRSSSNIYNQSLVASRIATHGIEATEAWARDLVANFARSPQGGDTDQIRAVAAGECDLAVVNHYYLARLLDSDDPADARIAEAVGMVFPDQDGRGAHANVSGAGVVATAPHPENAVRLLEYLVTPEAQRVFSRGSQEFPVVEGVPASETVRAFGSFETDDVNIAAYGEHNAEAVRLMDRVGWR